MFTVATLSAMFTIITLGAYTRSKQRKTFHDKQKKKVTREKNIFDNQSHCMRVTDLSHTVRQKYATYLTFFL